MSQTQQQTRLRHAASLFFDRLPPLSQQLLRDTFRCIDKDGDGHIALSELTAWARDSAAWKSTATLPSIDQSSIPTLFAFLDADANGTLDFEECKGLFFIGCADSHSCHGCGKLLLESAYACAECKLMKSASSTCSTFDLCLSCYVNFKSPFPLMSRTPKPSHQHAGLVEQISDLADAIDDVIDQVQCEVCKEYHRSNGQGVFTRSHVQVGGGPHKRTVCEWCIACLCYACGNHFQGPESMASSESWTKQTPHSICASCRQRGVRIPLASVFSQETLMKIQKSAILEECRTCKAKAKDGRLRMTVMRAISKPPGQTHGTNYPHNTNGATNHPHKDDSSNNSTSRSYSAHYPYNSYGSTAYPHKDGSSNNNTSRSYSDHYPYYSYGSTAYPYNSSHGSSSFGHTTVPPYHKPPNTGGDTGFSMPYFNPTGAYGSGTGSHPHGFMQTGASCFNNGSMGSSTAGFNFSDVYNMFSNMGTNMGASPGFGPFDLFNTVNNMGSMAGSVAGSMGVNPLDMINVASMCSIM